jgi:hypothetical protein
VPGAIGSRTPLPKSCSRFLQSAPIWEQQRRCLLAANGMAVLVLVREKGGGNRRVLNWFSSAAHRTTQNYADQGGKPNEAIAVSHCYHVDVAQFSRQCICCRAPAHGATLSVLLGEIVWGYVPFGTPGIRVDTYLYRQSTEEGWPWEGGPQYGTYFMPAPASEMRRQSWPTYQYTDQFGFYYVEFMLPRDEVWYPCSFPLKWKCNYQLPPMANGEVVPIEYHSPAAMVYECREIRPLVFECLDWPWAQDPQDTVAPLEVWAIDEFGDAYYAQAEVLGMYWKFSDLK